MTKKFRIRKVSNNPKALQYKIDQKHTILFFFHYWDDGAYDLCPNVLYHTKEEALKAIANYITDVSLIENCCKNE